jgi:hypothetical protein
MFDFLKKKLKIFEKNIEAEIESELKKEEKLEKRLQAEPELHKQPSQTISQVKTIEAPPTTLVVKEEERSVSTRKRAQRIQKPVSEEKKEREKQIDKQIEESIESELQRVLQTRKSIEEAVGTEETIMDD